MKLRLSLTFLAAAALGSCSQSIEVRFSPSGAKRGNFTFAEPRLFGGRRDIVARCIHAMRLEDMSSREDVWSQSFTMEAPCLDRRSIAVGEKLPGYSYEYRPERIVSGRLYLFEVSAADGVGGGLEFKMP